MIDRVDENGYTRMKGWDVAIIAFVIATFAGVINFVSNKDIFIATIIASVLFVMIYGGFRLFFGFLHFYEAEEAEAFKRYHPRR